MKPIIIGLPGAGKSTISSHIANVLQLNTVSTDSLFRIYRSIPLHSQDTGSEIMKNFLNRCQDSFPDLAPELMTAAQTCDEKGRCRLHDSNYFRSLGEDVFRLFEIEMNKWLQENGDFSSCIPDLSASAPLYAENRSIFSERNGFMIFLLDTPHEMIVDNLYKDYQKHRQLSEEAKEIVRLRGAYEIAVEKSLTTININLDNSDDEKKIIRQTLSDMSLQDRKKRMDAYRQFAHHVIMPTTESSIKDIAENILEISACPIVSTDYQIKNYPSLSC